MTVMESQETIGAKQAEPVVDPDAGDLKIWYEAEAGGVRRFVKTQTGTHESFRRCSSSSDLDGAWWLSFLRGDPEQPSTHRGRVEVVDLFCGSGGLSLGAKLAAKSLGFDMAHAFAADADPQALGIYRTNNRPRFHTTESVANLVSYQISTDKFGSHYPHTPKILNEDLECLIGSVDMVLAGPPCQGHSTANNKTRFNDPRNMLYFAVPAIAVALKAPTVIIENVPGVTASPGNLVGITTELLQSNGYTVTSSVIRSDAFGWPQTRRRFFLVATKDWKPVPLKSVDEALGRSARPISWALEDILNTKELSIMTESPSLSQENQRRIDYLHDNELHELPNSERPECHQNGTTYRAVYGRMRWDEPAPTITTGFMTPGRGRYVHPLRRRTLLPREAARIQGFPDNYRFELQSQALGRSAIAKGIGDAVPSILGFAAGLSALGNRA